MSSKTKNTEFTVTAILDGNCTAVLCTPDFREARVPTFCLPADVAVGAVVSLSVCFDQKKTEDAALELARLQEELLQVSGSTKHGSSQDQPLPDPWHTFFEPKLFRDKTREMITFAYDNYLTHAFPLDELDPIHCSGRGRDSDRTNLNINDVLGNYSLTLIDSLDTLAIIGNESAFWDAVFEANIRVLGGLLSAHVLASGAVLSMKRHPDYDDELLTLARDLASRLLLAFDVTPTGLPLPRINLRHGQPSGSFWRNDTCTAGVGTLLMEFGTLSRLTGDPVYEGVARRALIALWERRSTATGLLGSSIDVWTGRWVNTMAGLGAGIDSFFEYLLKSYILLGHKDDLRLFTIAFENTLKRTQIGDLPIYGNVDMNSGRLANSWIDSLQAYLPALKVLSGQVTEAAIDFEVYLGIWRRYHAFPERFNMRVKEPDCSIYPLRPELFESTYMLYRATGDRYYQRVGAELLLDIESTMRVKCGYATLHDVKDGSKEDRMESFFLSETLKYLFLLFDDNHQLHRAGAAAHIFSTEGHLFPVLASGETDFENILNLSTHHLHVPGLRPAWITGQGTKSLHQSCRAWDRKQNSQFLLQPEQRKHLRSLVGLAEEPREFKYYF